MEINDANQEALEKLVESEVDKKLESLVHKKVAEEENVRFRQLKWIMITIGIVGVGTFGTLANYLIEKAVDSRIERTTGNISAALDFMKFYNTALKLEIAPGYDRSDVELVMDYLRKAKDVKEVRHTKDFQVALYQVTKKFANSAQTAAIDEIFETYQGEILSAPMLVEPLLHHYGQELVGNEIESDSTREAFSKLERVAASSNVPELALTYRVLYEAKTSKDRDLVVRLLEQTRDLNQRDRARFFTEILLRTKMDNWMNVSTPEGRGIEGACRTLVSEYGDEIVAMYKLEENPSLLKAATEGLSTEEAEATAEWLAGG